MADDGAGAAGRGAHERAPWRWLALVALVSAGTSLTLSLWLFPVAGPIVDERAYVQQSIALEAERLTMPAGISPDHRPFFTTTNDDGETVFKYAPTYPAVLAASRIVLGTDRAVVPVVSFAAVFATGALAFELTRRRRVAIGSAIALTATPLFQVLAASRLAYALSWALVAGTAALLVAAMVRRSRLATVSAGLVGGLALFHRPFDAVVVLLPVLAWIAVRNRRQARQLLAPSMLMAAGAALPLAVWGWANLRTTGSIARLPFTFVAPRDKPGFGPRLDTATGTPFDFGPGEAWSGLVVAASATTRWVAAGPIGLAALAAGVWLERRTRAGALLAAVAATTVLGYAGFWGSWNGYVRLHVADAMGPIYHLPLAAVGAIGIGVVVDRALASDRRWARNGAIALLALGVLAGAALLRPALERLTDLRAVVAEQRDVVRRGIETNGPALVITEAPNLLYRDLLYNRPDLDNDVVGAVYRPGHLLDLLDRFPDRRAYLERRDYVFEGRPGTGTAVDDAGFDRSYRYEPAVALELKDPVVTLDFPDIEFGDVAYARDADGARTWTLAAPGSHSFQLDGVTMDGADGQTTQQLEPTVRGMVCIGIARGDLDEPDGRDERCYEVARTNGGTGIVIPGRGSTYFGFGTPRMLPSDVSDRIVPTTICGADTDAERRICTTESGEP